MHARPSSPLSRAAAAILIAATGLWFFGRALFTNTLFAVRDASHFYYPLFRWTTEERWAGRLPLWCPYEGLGTPLLADATASLFYPGQLLLFLPGSFEFNFKLYIVAHVFLAAFGTYRLTRHWRASPPAATIAAIGYACGGSVVFQYCNLVFLVGAAWLPFALQEVWGLLEIGERGTLVPRGNTNDANHPRETKVPRSPIKLALFLALMVLGGDPQLAYHVGIVAGVGLWFTRRRAPSAVALVVAALIAVGLSAVQVFPSVVRSGETTRAVGDVPRNIYETPQFAPVEIARGLFGVPPSDSHQETVYDFSLGPWRWLELVWPNVGGQALPTHRRWMSAIPAEGRLWTPSLFMGLVPALFGLAELFRRGRRRSRWLRATLLLFAAGSLGWYGVGWLGRELGAACGSDTRTWFLGQPVGGVYWFFITFLPGYVQFRYPAKLWTIVALCLACLAARGIDRMIRGPRGRMKTIFVGALAASLGLAAIVAAAAPRLLTIAVAADESLGPFDARGSLHDVLTACAATAVFAFLAWLLLRSSFTAPQLGWSLAVLTAVDLAAANGNQVIVAPADLWNTPRKTILDLSTDGAIPRFYRAPWENWSPRSWATAASDDRLARIAAWERATGFGRLPLLDRVGSLRGYATLRDADQQALLEIIEERRELATIFGAGSSLVPAQDDETPTLVEDTWLVGIKPAFPRAWFVDSIREQPPLPRRATSTARVARLREIYLPDDLRRTAFVEQPTEVPGGDSNATVRVAAEQAGELTLDMPVDCNGGFLVISTAFDRGWRATDDTGRPIRLQRANRVLLGASVPAGVRRIELRYRPLSFTAGAAVSGLTFAAVLLVSAFRRR